MHEVTAQSSVVTIDSESSKKLNDDHSEMMASCRLSKNGFHTNVTTSVFIWT